jgi:enterochelin esterase-like enzyme
MSRQPTELPARYAHGPDSFPQPGVPRGRLEEYQWGRSRYAVTDDHAQWAIAGGSSGGNCAFTAAWFRPDRFRRVYCSSGSFVQMPGGNPYPELIRTTPPKPLRIWLHVATRDLNWDKPEDNWLSAGLEVAAALAERGYDFRLVLGDGAHDGNHGGVLLPDALRWLWRPEPGPA